MHADRDKIPCGDMDISVYIYTTPYRGVYMYLYLFNAAYIPKTVRRQSPRKKRNE